MPRYLPNDLWIYINAKQWIDAEGALPGNTSWASSVGFVGGVTRGTQSYCNDYKSTYYDGEYPLSTALRMKAPDSLILALLKVYEDASSVKNEDGISLLI